MAGASAGVSTDLDQIVEEALDKWRNALINLTRRNRLLNFKPADTSAIPLVEPNARAVLEALASGKPLQVLSHPDEPEPVHSPDNDEHEDAGLTQIRLLPACTPVTTSSDAAKLNKVIRNLRNRANQQYLDTGLHVLYLSLGLLSWNDVDGEPHRSPLLLVPVTFDTNVPADSHVLRLAEEDPASNPALAMKMKDLGVEMPVLPDEAVSVKTFEQLLTDVGAATRRHPDWTVTRDVWLTYFSFTKEAMYRDLLDHSDTIAEHPQVQALAASGTGLSEKFHLPSDLLEEIDVARIDETRPPEDNPTVLDADASQRRVIAAVKAGNSVVVSGPPGTGKSQTITNMIAALLHEGRSVLFVSEKAAALEVVYNRLQDVGLGEYVLELHSHKATRAGVSKALSDALSRYPHVRGGLSARDRRAAKKARQNLNLYAAAINEIRQPLGQSVITVIGEVSLLHDLPTPEPTQHLAATLTPDVLADIESAARSIARAWRPAQQRKTFLWFGVAETGTLRPRLEGALTALARLREARRLNENLIDVFGWVHLSDTPRLTTVMTFMQTIPDRRLPLGWWTHPSVDELLREVADLEAEIVAIREADGRLTQSTGVAPSVLATIETPPVRTISVMGEVFESPDPGTITSDVAQKSVSAAQSLGKAVAAVETETGSLCRLLHIPPAQTIREAESLSRLLHLADNPTGVPQQWMSWQGLDNARTAAAALMAAQTDAAESAAAAAPTFTAGILDIDLPALRSRFANVHTGLKKLGGTYREDKRLLVERCQPGIRAKHATTELPKAIEWQARTLALTEAEQRFSIDLEPHYRGTGTDWDTINESLRRAEYILNLLGKATADLAPVTQAVNGDHPEQPALQQHLHQLDAHLGDVFQAARGGPHPAKDTLTNVVFTDVKSRVLDFEQHATRLCTTLAALDTVTGQQWNYISASDALLTRDNLNSLTNKFQRSDTHRTNLFRERYEGFTTDTHTIRTDLQWLQTLRSHCAIKTGFSETQAQALIDSNPQDLTETHQAWVTTSEAITAAFSRARQKEMTRDLDDFRDALELLEALKDDPDGQAEWFAFKTAMKTLEGYGLDKTVTFCVDRHVTADDAPGVIRKAVLSGWVDHTIDTDPRLQPFRLQDRAAITEQYIDLDRELINTAIADILERLNQRRPTAHGNQSAILLAEGSKKRRHMPIRQLIRQSQDVTLSIKPCFMMSPQSVSQYLPPDIQFDVVIFDEASQVKPEDAINSIYRGRELVIVGDENQMPPTSFYESVSTGDSDEVWSEGQSNATDFESILTLASGSASFDTLALQTHYRSRHEDLIAFSNHSFYSGDLHTFPSATTTNNDLGVAFYHTPDGEYQRATTRDNPREAELVVDRIVHHFDTRPDTTIGIVAFSQPQADAIERALEERVKTRPDLQDIDQSRSDRLTGLFIKNLETVQGDERDVILFSIGYGPDQHGRVTNNFGPINRPGGWRRLNVAVTRARNRVEVVSSIYASQITGVSNDSVRHLRTYLDYAERGKSALAFDDGSTYGDAESPFEESVIALLHKWGYQTESQVGTAGYRIDIGVRHPEDPNVFMLGIECDGYAYHSSKTARDRDRIRHEILQGLGWRLHHIWGTAWYRHRESAQKALREALNDAQSGSPRQGILAAPKPKSGLPTQLVEADLDSAPDWAIPYEPCGLFVNWATDPADPSSAPELREQIQMIVADEGPIHLDLVYERIRAAWGVGRIGARIRDAINTAIKRAKASRDGDFLCSQDNRIVVRHPGNGVHRTIQQIHPEELRLAITRYVTDSRGISADHLVNNLARLYGWTRTGANISAAIEAEIDYLLETGHLSGDLTRLLPPQ